MYISLYDLALVVLFILIVVIGIYLIAVLRQALCVLGQVRGVVEAHRGDLSESLSLFKETMANINALTIGLKETTENTSKAVQALPGEFADSVEELRESLETFAFYGKIVIDVVKTVFFKKN
jgi:uncharacterized protein YoxC